ncbi:MAG TPA: DUF1592 domain-containing protein [Polyangiaceae bacterium]|nr:DUF1592 domain-containing protein [Polyangiaceae bacterium]
MSQPFRRALIRDEQFALQPARRSKWCRAVALLAALTACQGAIEAPGASGDDPAGASGGASAATGGNGGSGGSEPGTGGGGGELLPPDLDPGRTALRRLNRVEYSNTLRDLLGTTERPGDSLPQDEVVEGMDTVGSALSFALVHLEVMESKTRELLDELFALPASDPRRARVLVCEPSAADAACTRQVLSTFARRAYRRPVLDQEIDGLVDLVDRAQAAGNGFAESLQAGLQAVLLSPHFIYRVEVSGTPSASEPERLSSHELATRLSYFLWSSMPDDALAQAADEDRLADDAGLRAELERMLLDPKAKALTENFAGQWLPIRRLSTISPDPALFPSYDESLRLAAAEETALFFEALVAEDLPLETLLSADFTFVNARLAEHYGLGGVTGDAFVRVSTAGTPRQGLLTQASYLMATSPPNRTSPVKRGIWVLEQLLCSPPPPVPNDIDVPPLDLPENATVRQTLEAHRANPSCAGCHTIIDPLGLGFESFDAIGAYRTSENGQEVDVSGVLDGVPFEGTEELIQRLVQDDRLAGCLAQQLLTYGVGRSFHHDAARAYARALAQHTVQAGQDRWQQFLTAVVMSEAFQTRRPEAP